MGFKRAVCQMKGFFFSLLCSKHTDANRFVNQNILIKNLFFHFYFLNQVFYFTIMSLSLLLWYLIDNMHLEGTVSQIFYVGPSFNFMTKNGKHFAIFCNYIFLIS